MKRILFLLCALLAFVGGTRAQNTYSVTIVDGVNAPYDHFGTRNNGVTPHTYTSGPNSGVAGVVMSVNTIDRHSTWWNVYSMVVKPSAAGTDEALTITAPEGYLIDGYSINFVSFTNQCLYDITLPGQATTEVSTAGDVYTASNLAAKTSTITIKAKGASVNWLGIKAFNLTLIDDPESSLINATYELYEGETLIYSLTEKVEKNSEVAIPSAYTSGDLSLYDYTIDGTIGETNTTIIITRTLKSNVLTSLSNLSNVKSYVITNARATWNVADEATAMTTVTNPYSTDATSQQFAILKKEDKYYLYSVNAKKFLRSDNTLGDPQEISINPIAEGSILNFFSFDASHNINVNGAGTILIDTWSTIDDGNSNAIIEAADFDATEAMAQLNAYLLSQIESGDITEYILANPSFELSAADTPLTEEKAASGEALDVYGWTMEGVGSKYNDTELRNASSTSTTSQFGTSAPSDGDYALFFRQGWNGDGNTITLTAEAQAELAAGNYVLSADYKQHYSHDGNPNSNTKVSLSVAGETVVSPAAAGVQGNSGDATYFNEAEWSTLSVPFTLDAATKPSIVITLNAAGQRRSDFFLDNVRLVKVSEAELALMALNAALEPANATVAAKANVGDDLFQIPTAAFDTYKTAVAEQQAVAEKTDATAEELKAALTALNAATEAYNATETTKPDAGKFYTLQLKDGGMYMALNEGTKLAAEPTILSFEAVEGGYALTDGTSYVACTGTGGNNWSMAAATTPYAWQFAALGDGYYTIAKATNAAEFIGVDNTGAGSSCYANKPVSDMSTWKLAEFVPTPTLIEGVAQVNVSGYNAYYEETTDLGIVYSGDLTAAVTTVRSNTDITLKNVQYTLAMYGMEEVQYVGNITFAGLAVNAEGNIDDTNVVVSFADGDGEEDWLATAHTPQSATVEGTLIDGKLLATFTAIADLYGIQYTYTITFGDELPSFEYTREGLTAGNFGTIVLNFPPETVTGIGQLYSIAGKVSDEGGNPLYIVLQEETAIEAGVPYIFQADATTITATAPSTAASVAEPKNYEIDWESWTTTILNKGLQGTFKDIETKDLGEWGVDDDYNDVFNPYNVYLISDNKVKKAAEGSTVAANRAYLLMDEVPEVTGDVKGLRIYLNDTTTGIQATKSADGKTVIFNLAGQRLQNAQKGINIVRGKKVLVK